jgi:hypothetical protein
MQSSKLRAQHLRQDRVPSCRVSIALGTCGADSPHITELFLVATLDSRFRRNDMNRGAASLQVTRCQTADSG